MEHQGFTSPSHADVMKLVDLSHSECDAVTGVLVRVQSSAPTSRSLRIIIVLHTNDLGSSPSTGTMPVAGAGKTPWLNLFVDLARIVKWYNEALIRPYWKFDSSYAHQDLRQLSKGSGARVKRSSSLQPIEFDSHSGRRPLRDSNIPGRS